jgi:hypothetical protein
MAIDRAYVEAHPEAQVYLRAPIPGEFDAWLDDHVMLLYPAWDCALVKVTQVAPGLRTRELMPWVAKFESDD